MSTQVDSRPMRRRPGTRTVAAIFGAAAMLAVAGCGEDSSDDIPSRQAEELLALLDSIESRVEAGDCEAAGAEASTLSIAVQELDRDQVPDDVITALTQGSESLEGLVEGQCGAEPDQTTTSSTTTTTAEETTTTEDTTTTTTATTTTTGTTTTTTPPDDGGTGGTGAGGTEAPTGQGQGGGG